MRDQPNDDTARQQRLAALRKLAGATPQSVNEAAPSAPSEPAPGQTFGARAGEVAAPSARRGRTALLVGLVALVILGGGGATLRLRGMSIGQPGARTSPTLVVKALSLSGVAGIYCSSAPAWSPNGKQLAVVGQINPQTDSCAPYNTQIALAQLSGGSVPYVTSNQSDGYALVILDSASGHVMQRITAPPLSRESLCDHQQNCFAIQPAMQSLAWSPDGRSVAVFFTYALIDGAQQQDIQPCGGLFITQVGGASAAPRLLLALGPQQPMIAGKLPDLINQLVAQRFTWNLATGAALVSAIPGGQTVAQSLDTTPFAPAYQWNNAGQLVAASAPTTPSRDMVTPWRSGAVGPRLSADTPALFRTSQWLWSPDGQFITPNLDTSAYVSVASAAPPTTAGGYTPPLVSAPDAALSAAITSSLSSPVGVELAQSPDGALLASYACTPADVGQLIIRATKSDTPLAQTNYTYPSSDFSLGCHGDIDALIWSPDGAHIAIDDEQNGQIIVWQVNVHA